MYGETTAERYAKQGYRPRATAALGHKNGHRHIDLTASRAVSALVSSRAAGNTPIAHVSAPRIDIVSPASDSLTLWEIALWSVTTGTGARVLAYAASPEALHARIAAELPGVELVGYHPYGQTFDGRPITDNERESNGV